jgi:hypothetical protein
MMKFDSFYGLESYLAGKGYNHILWRAMDIALERAKEMGYKGSKARQRAEDVIIGWWNGRYQAKIDLTYHDLAYALIMAVRKKLKEY